MATTGTFSIDTARISQSGNRFQEFSHDYTQIMTNLRTTIEDLGGCWKSDDYNQFVSIYEQNSEVIDQMSKAFAMQGANLVLIARRIERLEEYKKELEAYRKKDYD